jgi:hypothetical protein
MRGLAFAAWHLKNTEILSCAQNDDERQRQRQMQIPFADDNKGMTTKG